jgi:hypothetical protein
VTVQFVITTHYSTHHEDAWGSNAKLIPSAFNFNTRQVSCQVHAPAALPKYSLGTDWPACYVGPIHGLVARMDRTRGVGILSPPPPRFKPRGLHCPEWSIVTRLTEICHPAVMGIMSPARLPFNISLQRGHLTNSKLASPCSGNHELPHILWKPKVHCRLHKNSDDHIRSEINLVHNLNHTSWRTILIEARLHSLVFQADISFRFSYQHSANISCSFHLFNTPLRFNHPDNV